MLARRFRTFLAIALWPATWTCDVAQIVQEAKPGAQGSPTQPEVKYLNVPVSIETSIEPSPVKADDGKWYFVYNLFLWNHSFSALNINRVQIFDAGRGAVLADYQTRDLIQPYRFLALLPSPGVLRSVRSSTSSQRPNW